MIHSIYILLKVVLKWAENYFSFFTEGNLVSMCLRKFCDKARGQLQHRYEKINYIGDPFNFCKYLIPGVHHFVSIYEHKK